MKYVDKDGNSIIHYAAIGGLLRIVQYLIEKQFVDVNIKGNSDKTPLYLSCWKGHLQVAEYLNPHGANVYSITNFGDHIIHMASFGGLLPIVQGLVEKYNIDKDVKGFRNWTPLHNACKGQHIEVVQYLVSKDASVNPTDAVLFTPLHLVSKDCCFELIQYLVSKGAAINAKDELQHTPLYICMQIWKHSTPDS